jgi:hypothetical protein
VNRKDIEDAGPGSKSCPIARMLNRKFPPADNSYWSVGQTQATMYRRVPMKARNMFSVDMVLQLRLGAAAQKLVRTFDDAVRSEVRAQHIRLYPV